MQRLLNAVAVFADPSKVAAIRALPGVKSVRPLVLHTRANSTSVPFLGVPRDVWQALGNTGEGVKVGIVDSGIDYLHASFGGSGSDSDYIANDRTKAPDAFFPNARVVGGRDFAGDEYGSGGGAEPDPDPMDCDGHGSHAHRRGGWRGGGGRAWRVGPKRRRRSVRPVVAPHRRCRRAALDRRPCREPSNSMREP